MIIFRGNYNFKLIALLVAVAFFINTVAYCIDLSAAENLRNPVLLNKSVSGSQGEDRAGEGIGALAEDRGDANDISIQQQVSHRASTVDWPALSLLDLGSYIWFPLVVISTILFPAAFISGDSTARTALLWLFGVSSIPTIIVFFVFEPMMALPFRLSLTGFFRPDFYREYYAKSPEERAVFILEGLKARAREENNIEALEALSVVKKFRIVEKYPRRGKVFHVPTGELDISRGMTQQPGQMQYMIMRRARMMWYFGKREYRQRPLHYSDMYFDAGKFLLRNSGYINIYALYQLSLLLPEGGLLRYFRWLFPPLSRIGEANNGGQEMIYTIDRTKRVARKAMRENKIYSVSEFAEEFYFPEELARELVRELNAESEKAITSGEAEAIVKDMVEENRRMLRKVIERERQSSELNADTLEDCCGLASDFMVHRFKKRNMEDTKVASYQASTLFGGIRGLRHTFVVVSFPEGRRYLIDTSFAQFLNEKRKHIPNEPIALLTRMQEDGDPRYSTWADKIEILNKQGFIELTDEVSMMYGNLMRGQYPVDNKPFTVNYILNAPEQGPDFTEEELAEFESGPEPIFDGRTREALLSQAGTSRPPLEEIMPARHVRTAN